MDYKTPQSVFMIVMGPFLLVIPRSDTSCGERCGRRTCQIIASVAWVGGRGQVRLCLSIVGIFVLSARATAGHVSVSDSAATTSSESNNCLDTLFMYTNNNDNNRFMAVCPELPG